MLSLLDALSLHELIDLAERQGLIREAPACQECSTVGLIIPGEDEPVKVKIPVAMTLLRRMLRVHYGDPLVVRPPQDLIV
jgi:hypothetical protein